jgi:hypothetical protein
MNIRFFCRTLTGTMLLIIALSASLHTSVEQTVQAPLTSHVVIPFLANAARPADLDFEGGECERQASGNTMTCTFQQVFLTTSLVAPDTCLITTNRYEREFRRDAANRWVSTEGPDGECGVLDIATLRDEGGVHWTMETRKMAMNNEASAACKASSSQSETFSWQNIRRPLPCRFVQPGALSR